MQQFKKFPHLVICHGKQGELANAAHIIDFHETKLHFHATEHSVRPRFTKLDVPITLLEARRIIRSVFGY